MQKVSIKAGLRAGVGSHASRKDRNEGLVPGVLYGHGVENVHLTVNAREFEAALRHHSRLFELDLDGGSETALLAEVQYDAFGDHPIHADFRRVDRGEKFSVVVDLTFTGHPKGASRGGVFVRHLAELPIVCVPAAIPESLEIRVVDLDVGDGFKVSQLDLGEGVEVDLDPDTVICSVQLPAGVTEGVEGEEGELGGAPTEPELIGRKAEAEDED